MQGVRRSMLVAVAMAATLSTACEKPVAVAPQPPEVYVTTVVQKDVPVYLDLVGQTQGFQDVDIRARVEGFLDTVNFREGSFVRRGDLLYQIDPKPLQATLAQANAELATARARLAKADNDVARYVPLVAKQAVSQRELDDARAAQDAMRSQVEASKAAVDKATLDLGYVRITSPISGLVGTTQVKAGQPRRTRREHAPDDRVVDRPDHLPRRHHRGRLPPHHQARSDAGGAGKQSVRHRADAGRRRDASADRHDRAGRARRQQRHRYARRAAVFPQP